MQIPILNGIYTDDKSDFRTSYPRNLVPVPKQQGISNGYLRPADGIISYGSTGPGLDRGAINWNGVCYRVMGTKLVSVSELGVITIIGDVTGTTQVTFDYSFDYLGIASNGNLYLYDGTTLTQVTDTDLGTVVDFIWIDGYFMTTDGEFLVVTELNDPFSVLVTKYGSSEIDPDPIRAVLKLRNEAYALNRYTTEIFSNIGGVGFPFQRIEGAQMQRGTIGTHSCCIYSDSIAFLGSSRNESPAIWKGISSNTIKISTREIDEILLGYTELQLEDVVFEAHIESGLNHLYVRLPDQTLVYDDVASQVLGQSVWFVLTSGVEGLSQHRAANRTWCYNKWIVGDTITAAIGYQTEDVSTQWGEKIGWEFSTDILYNEGNGAIIHELELVGLTGRTALGDDPFIWTQYTLDGVVWSQEKFIKAGKIGERNKRLSWRDQGHMNNWRAQRFRGDSDAHLGIARLEARLEGLMF
jgi:hypothetical protein